MGIKYKCFWIILGITLLIITNHTVNAREISKDNKISEVDSILLQFLIKNGDYGTHVDAAYLVQNLTSTEQGYFYCKQIYNSDSIKLSAYVFFSTDSHSKRYIGVIDSDNQLIVLGGDSLSVDLQTISNLSVYFNNESEYLMFIKSIYESFVFIYECNLYETPKYEIVPK